jgi:hypothetical protein
MIAILVQLRDYKSWSRTEFQDADERDDQELLFESDVKIS